MPSLGTLPPELFREIGTYLAFFDKKSLVATSKACHALLGPVSCPDRLSWIVYVCRSSETQPYFQKYPLHPSTIQAELRALDARLIKMLFYGNWRHWKYEVDQCWSESSLMDDDFCDDDRYEPLLDVYFPMEKFYPKWMLLRFYLARIRSHAQRVTWDSDGSYHRDESVRRLDWLEVAGSCDDRIKKLMCFEGLDAYDAMTRVGISAQWLEI